VPLLFQRLFPLFLLGQGFRLFPLSLRPLFLALPFEKRVSLGLPLPRLLPDVVHLRLALLRLFGIVGFALFFHHSLQVFNVVLGLRRGWLTLLRLLFRLRRLGIGLRGRAWVATKVSRPGHVTV
jgi:hypothetical protein